jgi:arsenical pump membrane protein
MISPGIVRLLLPLIVIVSILLMLNPSAKYPRSALDRRRGTPPRCVAFDASEACRPSRRRGLGRTPYLFLIGMMLLSELANEHGVFNWLSSVAVRGANGSCSSLFTLVYGIGTIVTIFMSNDATAVVLTPEILTAVRKAKVEPLLYLSCAPSLQTPLRSCCRSQTRPIRSSCTTECPLRNG